MVLQEVGGGGIEIKSEAPTPSSGGALADWSTVASLNTPRQRHAVASLGGEIYAIGGEDDASNRIGSVEKYNPSTDTVSTVASLNTARVQHSAVSANGKIYVIGGEDSNNNLLSSVESYDPDADTWTTESSLTNGRKLHASAELNGFIYAISGTDGFNPVESVEEYEIATDTWTTVSGLNTPRRAHTAVSANGSVYAICGQDSNFNLLTSVEVYDQSADSWSVAGQLTTARRGHGSAAINDRIYTVSGDGENGLLNSIEEFNTTDNSVSSVPDINTARERFGVGVSAGQLYAPGGLDSGANVLSSIDAAKNFATVENASGPLVSAVDGDTAMVRNGNTGVIGSEVAFDQGDEIQWYSDESGYLYTIGE